VTEFLAGYYYSISKKEVEGSKALQVTIALLCCSFCSKNICTFKTEKYLILTIFHVFQDTYLEYTIQGQCRGLACPAITCGLTYI
jgi:hypothetical protein